MTEPSELKVPTVAVPAEVACLDGRTFRGRVFVPAAAARHAGPMRPEEWINEPWPFFPFLPDEAERAVILNKNTVLFISLVAPRDEEEVSGPTVVERAVTVECGGLTLEGRLRVEMPPSHSRNLDYLNRLELFLGLRDGEWLHLVQKHHITRVRERGHQD